MNVPTVIRDVRDTAPRAPAAGLAPSLEQRRLRVYLLQMMIDSALLIGTGALVGYFYFDGETGARLLPAAQLLLPLFQTIAWHNGTYSLDALTDWKSSSLKMVSAVVISAALLNFFAFFARMNAHFSRVVFVVGLTSAVVGMAAARFGLVKWIRRHWGPPINRLVIEAGGPPLTIADAYRIDAAAHGLVPSLEDPHALDRLSRYLRNMDQVIVNCPLDQRGDWAKVLKGSGVHGEVTSELVREIGALGVLHRHDSDVSTLLVSTGPLGIRARITKRAFDLAVAGGALVVLSPLLLAAALAIKLEDGGPVLFTQRRLGRGNRFFPIFKLRTMRAEAGDADGNRSTARADERVTRIGRFLRATSIDELPQLINVVRGEMSLVGPRPLILEEDLHVVDWRRQRLNLKPGITGLWQVLGRDDIPFEEMVKLDYLYVTTWSLMNDLKLVMRTIPVLFRAHNA